MDNKQLKNAVILSLISLLTVIVIFAFVFISIRGPSCGMEASRPSSCSKDQSTSISMTLIKYSPTFAFDGIKDSVQLLKIETPDNGQTWNLLYVFKTAHPGHGDRGGQVLAEVITEHSVQITVSNCKITSAVCDKTWDLLKER